MYSDARGQLTEDLFVAMHERDTLSSSLRFVLQFHRNQSKVAIHQHRGSNAQSITGKKIQEVLGPSKPQREI